MKILSCEQMRALEKAVVHGGATYLNLMEQAGSGAARVIRQRAHVLKNVTVLCGKGNNGGDGFVIARKLQEWGAQVTVLLLEGNPLTEDAALMFDQMEKVEVFSYEQEEAARRLELADVIVDAVYGIGFRGKIREEFEPLIQRVNRSQAQVFAIDLPSGAQGDTGTVEGSCVRADVTVTFTTLKPAHVLYPAADYCGDTVIAQVGIEQDFIHNSPCIMEAADDEWVKKVLPVRASNSHKGTYGTLLSVCGSRGMAGAAMMSGCAALRSGAGLVKMAIPQSIYPMISGALWEPVFAILPENEKGTLSAECKAELLSMLSAASACLIGCGLGCNADTEKLVYSLLTQAKIPLIIDADGINALLVNIDSMKTARAPVILTPHPGEMARLLGVSTAQIQSDRFYCAKSFAMEYHVTLVLKGANTLIAMPDGTVFVNRTGNPGMARGGSGDVLAGMIASFVAQGIAPGDAAVAGAYLHGLAGDRCAAKYSKMGMLPTDLIVELPGLFLKMGR